MTDRVYPSAKPNPTTTAAANPGAFPATKAQLYGASRPAYRPQPKPQRRRRSCCCCCFLWTTLFIIALVLMAAIAGAVFWVLYRPQRPSFSVTTLKISQFNITSPKKGSSATTDQLNSKMDLTIFARNPNKKIVFFYDPMTVTMNSHGIDVGDGTVPSFVHEKKNTTLLKASLASVGTSLDDPDSEKGLKSDLEKKNGFPLEIKLETKVRVKIGSFKSKKVGIKVTCDRIQAVLAKGKSPSSLSTSDGDKCKGGDDGVSVEMETKESEDPTRPCQTTT